MAYKMTVMGAYDLDERGRIISKPVPAIVPGKDYGADPVGDGTFRMVPSGDIVDFAERNRRLAPA
jgi:hypothetical protein